MYIMCVILCLFSALSCRVHTLQISIIIIIHEGLKYSICYKRFSTVCDCINANSSAECKATEGQNKRHL